jgi:hypothetical protein
VLAGGADRSADTKLSLPTELITERTEQFQQSSSEREQNSSSRAHHRENRTAPAELIGRIE